MRKMKTRILSLVLALALMFSMIPLGIFAEGEPAGDEPVSDGRGTGEYANAEGVLTYDSEEGGILNSTDTTKTFNILNKVSAAAPKVVFEFDFKWNSTASTNDNVMWINFLNATGDRMHSEWDRGGFYAKNGTLSFVPINSYADADADDVMDNAIATLDVSTWYNIRYEFTYTFNGDAVTGVNRQIFVNGESLANYDIGLAGLADLKIAKAELATASGRAFNCDYDNVYFDVPGAPAEEEPVTDNRGTGKYANAEGVLTYDSEANEVLNSTDTTKTFEIISPVSANATEVVLEFDFKWNSTGSADDNVMWINFLNANGDRMHSEWDRGGLYIKNGTLFLVPINNYGDSDADGNLDAAIATLDVSTWYNIRYEFTYTYTGEDVTAVNRKISVNGVTVANYAIGVAGGLEDLKIAKAEFATASGRAFNCDYDNLYFNAYTNPLTIPAPGEGLFAGAEATEKYDDQPKGFREAGGALTYDYAADSLLDKDLFIYEFDFRWTDFGYSEQYDAEKGSYISFNNSLGANTVISEGGRLCIKFKSADDDYAYLTTIGTTLVDADEDGIYDNAIAKFTRSEWYNIRFVVSEVTHNGTQFTPTIYVFINGEMLDANGGGTGYGLADQYDKSVDDRATSWAPYKFSMSARSGLKFDIDNFYTGASILGTKGNGEYAEAIGVVEGEVSHAQNLEVTVLDSSENYVGEIFVYELDFALTAANPKEQYDKNWVGYFSFFDVNGNLMTTNSGRVGICSDGSRVVLCGNANSGNFELNEDGSVKNAYVEFNAWEWHTIKIVVRFSPEGEGYVRRVETYLDGELVEDAWDGTATSIPEFGSVVLTSRGNAMSYKADNVYLSAFETVATVNGKPYESVDAAIAAANNGDTVKVLESVAEGDEYIVPDGKMVYLEVAGENDTALVFAREMEGNTYVVVENTYFEFLGGSLRYEDAVDGSTNIRLGYRFTDAFDFATDMWAWEYTLGNNPAGNRMGENYNAENRNSNIVFTNVGVANYEKAITARLGIAVEIEGTDYVVFDVARTYTVLGVAEALVESGTATVESKEYAQSIIDAYAAYLESLEPQE